jgi:hypothetical protein
MGRECRFALGLGGGGSLRSFAGSGRHGWGVWVARPDSTPHSTPLMAGLITGRADATWVAALGPARAEGDAPTGRCVILIDQRERRISQAMGREWAFALGLGGWS